MLAVGAHERMTIVREELEPPVRGDDETSAAVAPQPLHATRHRREDVVRVHRAQDPLRAVPLAAAHAAPDGHRPALETAHADRVQELLTVIVLDRHGGHCVLSRRQEEGAVDQREAVEYRQRAST